MAHSSNKYYVPESTRWPLITSVGLFIMFGGISILLNGGEIGQYAAYVGCAIVIWMMFSWFGEVISESEGGTFNEQVDTSFRMGMFWFIFSEVMFFACFFGALWYARNLSLPWLAGEGNNFLTNQLIWDGFEKSWPSNGRPFARWPRIATNRSPFLTRLESYSMCPTWKRRQLSPPDAVYRPALAPRATTASSKTESKASNVIETPLGRSAK